MSLAELQREELVALPQRLETSQIQFRNINALAAWQRNWARQHMGACQFNCVQIINQYNIIIVIQR